MNIDPLTRALERDDVEYIHGIIRENPKKLNRRTRRAHQTLLHRAVLCRSVGVVELLLHSGAKTEKRDWEGYTPLLNIMRACNRDEENPEDVEDACVRITEMLLDAGANVEAFREMPGDTIMRFAIYAEYYRLFNLLCSRIVDIRFLDEDRENLLYYAVCNGDVRFIQGLKNLGVDIHYCSDDYGNIVNLATGFPGVLSVIVGWGVDVNVRNSHGCTPLILAVNRNYIESVRILLENGADTSLTKIEIEEEFEDRRPWGWPRRRVIETEMTALDYAKDLGYDDIAALIKGYDTLEIKEPDVSGEIESN